MVKSRVWVALGNEGTRLLASTSQQLCSQRTASFFHCWQGKTRSYCWICKRSRVPYNRHLEGCTVERHVTSEPGHSSVSSVPFFLPVQMLLQPLVLRPSFPFSVKTQRQSKLYLSNRFSPRPGSPGNLGGARRAESSACLCAPTSCAGERGPDTQVLGERAGPEKNAPTRVNAFPPQDTPAHPSFVWSLKVIHPLPGTHLPWSTGAQNKCPGNHSQINKRNYFKQKSKSNMPSQKLRDSEEMIQ